MQRININEADKRFKHLLDEVRNGEEIVITEKNQPIAKLVPIPTKRPKAVFGSAKGLIAMSDDFDEPLEDFIDYM